MYQENPQKLILGCGNFGGIGSLPECFGKGDTPEDAHNILDLAREVGISKFDTANSYGNGLSEEILGEWLSKQEADFRKTVSISTKVGNPFGRMFEGPPLSASEISANIERSLKRLGREKIDILYLHERDAATPLIETIGALEKAFLSGKFLSLGLSNVSRRDVEYFLQCIHGTSLFHAFQYVQNEFHYLYKDDLSDLIPYLVKKNIFYVSYSPLCGGLLTGKYKRNREIPKSSRLELRPDAYRQFINENTFNLIEKLQNESQKINKSVSQIALNFVLDTVGVEAAIIGPRRKEHYEDLGFKFR